MFQPLTDSWHDIYHNNLLNVYISNLEITNHTFKLTDPLDNIISSKTRGFKLEFTEKMYEWIKSGGNKVTKEMIELNPTAAKFETWFHGANTAYGPRIDKQWDYAKRELERSPYSRRACIMLLNPHDRRIADALAEKQTRCEYICTFALTFQIRKGGLDLVATMRSNNYTTTVCQDVYIFTQLLRDMAQELGIPIGTYYHSAVSAHILEPEVYRAGCIIQEYITSLAGPFCDTFDAISRHTAFSKAKMEYAKRKLEGNLNDQN